MSVPPPKKEYPAEKLLRYNMGVRIFTTAANVPFAQYANGFTVRNSGTTWLLAAGILLKPGESFAIGGNRAEIFEGRIDLKFTTQSPAPATVVNEATITEKFYTNING
jgi:hypothetical protein